MITNLAEIAAVDGPLFGSKAAFLGELHSLGIVIVPGFAISIENFNSIFRNKFKTTSLENKRKIFEKLKDDVDFQKFMGEINRFLSELEFHQNDLAIVRSSATVEDSGIASFAGQFDSVVVEWTLNEVMEGIIQVWTSVFKPAIVDYQSKMATEHRPREIEMGVIVQKHIEFDYSGVLFSRHPTVHLPGWMLVEYVTGNPNKLVDGSKSPSRCRMRIDGKQWLWEEKTIGFEKMNQDIKSRLSSVVKQVLDNLGYDVDMEWGVKGNLLYILQCRPITT